MHQVALAPRGTDELAPLLDVGSRARLDQALGDLAARVEGRRLWHINSTERGGGVAELLSTLLPYGLGAGAPVGWLVLDLDPSVFDITKRLHNWLHGGGGPDDRLGAAERAAYDAGLRAETGAVLDEVAPGDIVVLHDPQTAGLIPALRTHGALVLWRCHIGADEPNERVRDAHAFLLDAVTAADVTIFSRRDHVWEGLDPDRTAIVPPCIDVVSPKNRGLDPAEAERLLEAAGLQGASPSEAMVQVEPIAAGHRLVVQVSRWDRLKDPVGVVRAFVDHGPTDGDVHLCLAGPATEGVTDDPEGAEVFDEVRRAWEDLALADRRRVHLASLPMEDLHQNALMVNALQRRASVVVQKSLAEGFGLTVAEAMWKERPVVATRVGGIQDQIDHGTSGWLIDDASDLAACGEAIAQLLDDPQRAVALGRAAHARVCDRFLPGNHIAAEVAALDRLPIPA